MKHSMTSITKDLMVVSTLSSVLESSFVVTVANISDEGIVLRPGMVTGTDHLILGQVVRGCMSVEASRNRIHVSVDLSPTTSKRCCLVDLEGLKCTASEKCRLDSLVMASTDMFFQDNQDPGYTEQISHTMTLQDNVPVNSTLQRIPPTQIQGDKDLVYGNIQGKEVTGNNTADAKCEKCEKFLIRHMTFSLT